MPLRSVDGHVLGSFCVVDPVARQWTKAKITALADLAAAVQSELRLRAALQENHRAADPEMDLQVHPRRLRVGQISR